MTELLSCPFCGGDVSFHKDEECAGCHLIQCGQCRAFFDFATGADPGNDCASVDALRAAIAPMWNARAQLAAIQGGMGEVVEVVGWLGGNGIHAEESMASGAPFPLMTIAQHQRITAAMAAELADAKSARDAYGQNAIDLQKQRDALRAELETLRKDASAEMFLTLTAELAKLRAELAEVKGREVVATIEQREPYEDGTPNPGNTLRWAGNNAEDDLPAGTKLYAMPPASPDVEGLVKVLEDCLELIDTISPFEGDTVRKARSALSTWRQAQEGKP